MQPNDPARSQPGTPHPERIARVLREREVRYVDLQFSDGPGGLRTVEVPTRLFQRAVERHAGLVEGAPLGGFVWLEESDIRLKAELETFQLLERGDPALTVGQVLCGLLRPDGTAFEGDPRAALRRVVGELDAQGLRAEIGTEIEFFLLPPQAWGRARARGGWSGPLGDADGAAVRGEIVVALEALGYEVEASHAEVAAGQHQINLEAADPLTTADRLARFRQITRSVAARHGLEAVFMPKPFSGRNGSGVHARHLLKRDGRNAFHDPDDREELSGVLRGYVGGLLEHARAFCAVTNPSVNSYKRLVPGFHAPVDTTWSFYHPSAMVRVPLRREEETHCEIRLPDLTANAYLSLAVQLAAGLDGIQGDRGPGEPVTAGGGVLGQRERSRRRIDALPRNLGEAIAAMEGDRVVRRALGEHLYAQLLASRRAEWNEYLAEVHPWERRRYAE
jgi:glutamine synthetase